MELETIEDATNDVSVNIIRRVAMKALKKGQCAFASDICKVTAQRILLLKYRQGKIEKPDKDHVRLLTGYLVQKARKGLVMKYDPVLCVRKGERWIIKRRD